jgi:hypothetical protein
MVFVKLDVQVALLLATQWVGIFLGQLLVELVHQLPR